MSDTPKSGSPSARNLTAGNVAESRVAIVTGASSGIGEACARALAQAGFRVAVAARRRNELERLAKEIESAGGEALVVAADLAQEAETHEVAQQTLATFGRVDVLLNNAGFSYAGALEQLSRSEVRNTFEVNLLAGLQLAGELAPVMREQGGGTILNMSSLAARVPAPLAVPYAATKGAIEAASDCLRLELSPWKIHVSSIIPGFVDTPTFDKSREWGSHLREDETNPYQQLMFDMDDFAKQQLRRAVSPAQVAEVVVRAATAARPRARYFVPFSAHATSTIFGALPTRLSDRILGLVYKLGKLGA